MWLAAAFLLVSDAVSIPLARETLIVIMILLLAIVVAPIVAWHVLLRPSGLLLVFLSRFATIAPEHDPDAATHALKMRDGLLGCAALMTVAEVRTIGTALDQAEAARILDASSALAVVFGRLLIADTEMEARAEILRQRPPVDPREQPPASPNRRRQPATEHRVFTDPGIPRVRLVRGPLDERHASWIEQELLATVAAFPLER